MSAYPWQEDEDKRFSRPKEGPFYHNDTGYDGLTNGNPHNNTRFEKPFCNTGLSLMVLAPDITLNTDQDVNSRKQTSGPIFNFQTRITMVVTSRSFTWDLAQPFTCINLPVF